MGSRAARSASASTQRRTAAWGCTAGSFSVTALDPYGNVATGYSGTVHVTSSDGQGALPADYSFTASDNGSHSFNATLETAGSQSLTVADADGITASQIGISVDPAAASSLIVSGFGTPHTAGPASYVSVTALDPYDNVATGFSCTTLFRTSDGQGALPADYSFTASDNGSHSFNATLKTAGSQSLTVADAAGITGSQGGISVSPTAASSLIVS